MCLLNLCPDVVEHALPTYFMVASIHADYETHMIFFRANRAIKGSIGLFEGLKLHYLVLLFHCKLASIL